MTAEHNCHCHQWLQRKFHCLAQKMSTGKEETSASEKHKGRIRKEREH